MLTLIGLLFLLYKYAMFWQMKIDLETFKKPIILAIQDQNPYKFYVFKNKIVKHPRNNIIQPPLIVSSNVRVSLCKGSPTQFKRCNFTRRVNGLNKLINDYLSHRLQTDFHGY